MEKLKELLGEELFNQVKAKLGDTKLIIDDGSFIRKDSGDFVPRERLNELNNKHKTELDERDKKLTELQAAVKDNEGATKLVEDMQKANETLKTQNENLAKENELIQKKGAVKDALVKAKCKFPDLFLPRFDYDNVKNVNGKWIGIDDQINILKDETDYKDAFGEIKITGDDPSGNNHDSPLNKKFSEMSLSEKAILKRENPQKYDEMRRKG